MNVGIEFNWLFSGLIIQTLWIILKIDTIPSNPGIEWRKDLKLHIDLIIELQSIDKLYYDTITNIITYK